jgi:hypothetical protein
MHNARTPIDWRVRGTRVAPVRENARWSYPSDGAAKVAAADAKRARRNAKRAREAAKVGG